MFDANSRLLHESFLQPVGPSKTRVVQMLRNHPKILWHFVLHHVVQLALLVAACALSMGLFGVFSENSTGRLGMIPNLVITNAVFTALTPALYLLYIVFFALTLTTHPLFTLTLGPRPTLFVKLANLTHLVYLLFPLADLCLALLLAFAFDPTVQSFNAVYITLVILVVVVYFQLSTGEMCKIFGFVPAKVSTVDLAAQPEEFTAFENTEFDHLVAEVTFAYDLLGFNFYFVYQFAPNAGKIHVLFYFVGILKEFN